MDIFYIFCLVVAAIYCFRSGHHTRLPWFFWSVIASILFEFAYQPFSTTWLRKWYPGLVAVLLSVRTIAATEAFWLHASRFPFRWQLATSTGSLSLLFALIVAWRFNALDMLDGSIQLRRVVVVGLAAFLGIYTFLVWSVGRLRLSLSSIHLVLLFLLFLVMSVSSVLRMVYPEGVWYAVSPVAYGISSAIYLGWAFLFARLRKVEP